MKKRTVQTLSFISGLTLAAVVVGVTLSKSPGLRGEIEHQINSVLKSTRTLVNAYKSVVSKSKVAVNLVKNDVDPQGSGGEETARQTAELDNQWNAAEARVAQ
jgi:hypothetical protein